MERVAVCTEYQTGGQYGFTNTRWFVNQVIALMNVQEKYLEKQKDLYKALMVLEIVYDSVNRCALCEGDREYMVWE